MGYSKNTISKYIAVLEATNKIYKRAVGRYKLYFSTKNTFISRGVIIPMFKALFKAIKEIFPSQEEKYKEIGKELQNNVNYRYSKGFFKNEETRRKAVKNIIDFKPHFDYFIEVFNAQNTLQDTVQVNLIRYENNNKRGFFRFRNSDFLESTDEHLFYFYMIAGIIENYLGSELNREIRCKILDVNISKQKEECYVDMSIDIIE